MEQDYLLSNRTYDFLKRVVTIFLPGLAALYAVLSVWWDEPDQGAVLGTLGALALLGGLLMAISTKSWNSSMSKYDVILSTMRNDPDTGIPDLQLNIIRDPASLVERKTLYFKSVDEREEV